MRIALVIYSPPLQVVYFPRALKAEIFPRNLEFTLYLPDIMA